MQSVILIGPMGAGKSTVGRLLAGRLHLPFYDSDSVIVQRTGVSIPTIFEIEGEDGFRAREARVLADLAGMGPMVLATGGGIVLRPENRAWLKAMGRVVYLDVSVDEQLRRVRMDSNRPLLQVADPRARLETLQGERAPLYRELADLTLRTDGLRAEQVVGQIVKFLKDDGADGGCGKA